jgi:hypothetical protein
MTGPELKQLRADLGKAIGKGLTAADMAKLCGPSEGGADTAVGSFGPERTRSRAAAHSGHGQRPSSDPGKFQCVRPL